MRLPSSFFFRRALERRHIGLDMKELSLLLFPRSLSILCENNETVAVERKTLNCTNQLCCKEWMWKKT